MKNAKICRDCGSMDYRQEVVATTTAYSTTYYSFEEEGCVVEDDGEDVDTSDDYGEWEPEGAPECAECDSKNLADLSKLSKEELLFIYKLPEEQRVAVADKMLAGTFKPSARRGAKFIGKVKVIQC